MSNFFSDLSIQTVELQIGDIQCILAAIVYKFIIDQRGNVQAYLLGWGVFFSFVLAFPYWLLETFDMRNKVVKLATGPVSMIVGFSVHRGHARLFPSRRRIVFGLLRATGRRLVLLTGTRKMKRFAKSPKKNSLVCSSNSTFISPCWVLF
jgi:hypothetical protein